MADLGSLSTEEDQDLDLASAENERFLRVPSATFGKSCFWRFSSSAALLAGFMLLALSLLAFHRPGHHVLVFHGSLGIEQKFYDGTGSYWQAPNRGVSSSEFWSDCEQPHLSTCGAFCCCEEGYYWKSPKTIYEQTRKILRSAVMRTAGEEAQELSAASAEGEAQKAVKDVGKAAVKTLVSTDQKCVPKAEVPADVVKALADGAVIPGSRAWSTCSAFTSHAHTCGEHCCCNGGYKWSLVEESCL